MGFITFVVNVTVDSALTRILCVRNVLGSNNGQPDQCRERILKVRLYVRQSFKCFIIWHHAIWLRDGLKY